MTWHASLGCIKLEAGELAQIDDETCRKFIAGVELAGKRWSAAILLAAARGAVRYSEYHRMIDGISERLLAQRLPGATDQVGPEMGSEAAPGGGVVVRVRYLMIVVTAGLSSHKEPRQGDRSPIPGSCD